MDDASNQLNAGFVQRVYLELEELGVSKAVGLAL
jgi:hypothetical protein